MRVRIGHLATPRRIVATECCLAAVAGAVALLITGPTVLGWALLIVCVACLAPVVVALDRLDKRGIR